MSVFEIAKLAGLMPSTGLTIHWPDDNKPDMGTADLLAWRNSALTFMAYAYAESDGPVVILPHRRYAALRHVVDGNSSGDGLQPGDDRQAARQGCVTAAAVLGRSPA